MKKKLIVIVLIIIIVLLGIIILFAINNKRDMENSSNEYDKKQNKVILGDISEIKCKNIYVDNEGQKEDVYNVINKDKITRIKELLEFQELNELYEGERDKNYIEIKIYNDGEEKQLTVFDSNIIKINEKKYQVNTEIYKELIYVLKPTYYLHNSDLEVPNQEKCEKMQEKALNKLDKEEVYNVSKKLRDAHVTMEYLLIDGTNNLKESNSVYWNLYNNADTITEPNGEKLDFTNDRCFNAVAENINKITEVVKDENIKKNFEEIFRRLQSAMENKDIAEMFEIHKIIHDYDYWIINYPAYFDTAPAPDWEGVETYFGTKI